MPTNDFLPFAAAGGSNVASQAAYAAAASTATGFVTGTASSAMANKALRQASLIAAMIAQTIVDQTGENVVDDGTTATIEEAFADAIVAIMVAGLNGLTISNVIFQNVRETVQAVAAAATTTLDYSLGGAVKFTRNAAVTTLAFANLPPDNQLAIFTLRMISNGTYAFTWPASIKWTVGVPPPLTAAGRDTVTLYTMDGGATWSGSYSCGEA